jgi:hypothetical protein
MALYVGPRLLVLSVIVLVINGPASGSPPASVQYDVNSRDECTDICSADYSVCSIVAYQENSKKCRIWADGSWTGWTLICASGMYRSHRMVYALFH